RVPPLGRFRQAGRVRGPVSKEGQGGLRGRTPSHEFLGGRGGPQAVSHGNRRRRVQVRRFEAAAGRGLSSGQGRSSGRNLVIDNARGRPRLVRLPCSQRLVRRAPGRGGGRRGDPR